MPGLQTKTYGTGDYSWMLNTDGLDEAISGVLDVSSFTAATHYPDGYFPCGLPVNIADRSAVVPWSDTAAAEGDPDPVLAFLKGDFKTDGSEDVDAAFILRGNVKTAKVPLSGFAAPTTVPQPRFTFWS